VLSLTAGKGKLCVYRKKIFKRLLENQMQHIKVFNNLKTEIPAASPQQVINQ